MTQTASPSSLSARDMPVRSSSALNVKYPTLSFDGDPYHMRPCESRKGSRMVFSECGNGYSTVVPVCGSNLRTIVYGRLRSN